MKKDRDANIFQSAARRAQAAGKKKKEGPFPALPTQPSKKETPKIMPAPASESKEKPKPKTIPQEPSSELQLKQMFEKMRDLQQDLEAKLEEAYAIGGIGRNTIKGYIDSLLGPEIERLKKDKEKLEAQIYAVLGEDAKIKQASQSQTKHDKTRKAKSMGVRRKWLPMK